MLPRAAIARHFKNTTLFLWPLVVHIFGDNVSSTHIMSNTIQSGTRLKI